MTRAMTAIGRSYNFEIWTNKRSEASSRKSEGKLVVARKVRIFGRVQGVFFRQWAVNQARAVGVSGWVRNAPDGTVEAHVFGGEDAVAKMIEGMRKGPSQARVEDLTVESIEPEDITGFSVRH